MSEEILTHIIDIKTTLASHTERLDHVKEDIAEIKKGCPIERDRIDKLEKKSSWNAGALWVFGGLCTIIFSIIIAIISRS